MNLQMVLASGVLSALLGLNAYFIKALVKKIEKVDAIEGKLDVHYAQFGEQIKSLEQKMTDLSSRVQDVGRLKERVAVLEFALANEIKFHQDEAN